MNLNHNWLCKASLSETFCVLEVKAVLEWLATPKATANLKGTDRKLRGLTKQTVTAPDKPAKQNTIALGTWR